MIEQVAAAPVPPPPEIVIVGASVYPNPELVTKILSMDVTFALVDVIATAVAVDPDKPEGDVLNPIIGITVNP